MAEAETKNKILELSAAAEEDLLSSASATSGFADGHELAASSMDRSVVASRLQAAEGLRKHIQRLQDRITIKVAEALDSPNDRRVEAELIERGTVWFAG